MADDELRRRVGGLAFTNSGAQGRARLDEEEEEYGDYPDGYPVSYEGFLIRHYPPPA